MNFKCSLENENKKAVILKEIEPLTTMKQLESIIAEKMEVVVPFLILTGYPPAILLYEPTDPINTKLKRNDLLLINVPSTDSSNKKPTISKNTNKKTPMIREKKNNSKTSKPLSSPNISYFSDQVSSKTAKQLIGDKKQGVENDDDEYELDDSEDDGVIGENSRSKRNRPKVQYIDLENQKEEVPKMKKKPAAKRKNDNKTDSSAPKKKVQTEERKKPVSSKQTIDITDRPPSMDFIVEVITSQDDPFNLDKAKSTIEEVMAEALNPIGNGNFSKMKQAFQTGMELEQEETKGNSRFKTMCEKSEKFEKLNSLTEEGRPQYSVTFIHNDEEVQETFELLSKQQLQALLTYIILTQGEQGKQGLRARNMSIISPRSFWSMVYHFGSELEEGLKKLLPRMDWSFLEHRVRMKSQIGQDAEESKQSFSKIEKNYQKEKKRD
jgi:hypothetical protein